MQKPLSIFLAVSVCCLGAIPSADAQSKGKKGKGGKHAAAAAESSSSDDAPPPSKSMVSAARNAPPPEGVCVSPDAPTRVTACPSNTPKSGKGAAGAPSSKLQEAKRKVEQPKLFSYPGRPRAEPNPTQATNLLIA